MSAVYHHTIVPRFVVQNLTKNAKARGPKGRTLGPEALAIKDMLSDPKQDHVILDIDSERLKSEMARIYMAARNVVKKKYVKGAQMPKVQVYSEEHGPVTVTDHSKVIVLKKEAKRGSAAQNAG